MELQSGSCPRAHCVSRVLFTFLPLLPGHRSSTLGCKAAAASLAERIICAPAALPWGLRGVVPGSPADPRLLGCSWPLDRSEPASCLCSTCSLPHMVHLLSAPCGIWCSVNAPYLSCHTVYSEHKAAMESVHIECIVHSQVFYFKK